MIQENEITKLYDSYADWKGWLDHKKFLTLSEKEKSHFTNQFKKINPKKRKKSFFRLYD